MSDTLTIIISILVPTIGTQIGFMLFIFRRMDRMEERLTQRMDRADDDRTQMRIEFRKDSQKMRAEFREDSQKTRAEFREDMQNTRAELAMLQTSVARLEGAVEILRSLAERIVPAPR